MKKLVVFLMIPALVLLSAALGAAQDANWGAIYSIKGKYAVTGYSTCNPASAGIFEADYTFNGDGTGSVTNGFVRSFTSPTSGGAAHYTADFTYEVTDEGRITFAYPPCYDKSGTSHETCGNHIVKKDATDTNTLFEVLWNLGPGHGVISPDGKTITITCGPPVKLKVIWTENPRETPGVPAVNTEVFCVTTGAGVRIH